MKVNIKRLAVLVVITVMATFILTAMASAGSLKTQGQYVSTGSGTCFIALKGFNDTGVPNPWASPPVPDAYKSLSWSIQTFSSEGVWTFERDGTGSLTGTNRSVTLPYSLPSGAVTPSAGVQEVSFAFHYDVDDDGITITADPGTYVIEWTYGPNNGIAYHLNGFSRKGSISPDGKTIILNGGVPNKMTFVESLGGTLPPGVSQNICNGSYVLIWQNDKP
jgi:hypothetical protein